jgi:hypothetical protein
MVLERVSAVNSGGGDGAKYVNESVQMGQIALLKREMRFGMLEGFQIGICIVSRIKGLGFTRNSRRESQEGSSFHR